MQSCKIYDKQLSVSEAASIRKPVKIIMNSNLEYRFAEIYYKNDQLLGRPHVAGLSSAIFPPPNIVLQEEDIHSVHLRNTEKLVYSWVGFSLAAVGITMGLIYWAIMAS
jgi:hypothetical protein